MAVNNSSSNSSISQFVDQPAMGLHSSTSIGPLSLWGTRILVLSVACCCYWRGRHQCASQSRHQQLHNVVRQQIKSKHRSGYTQMLGQASALTGRPVLPPEETLLPATTCDFQGNCLLSYFGYPDVPPSTPILYGLSEALDTPVYTSRASTDLLHPKQDPLGRRCQERTSIKAYGSAPPQTVQAGQIRWFISLPDRLRLSLRTLRLNLLSEAPFPSRG